MKRLLFFLGMAALMVFAGCEKSEQPTPSGSKGTSGLTKEMADETAGVTGQKADDSVNSMQEKAKGSLKY